MPCDGHHAETVGGERVEAAHLEEGLVVGSLDGVNSLQAVVPCGVLSPPHLYEVAFNSDLIGVEGWCPREIYGPRSESQTQRPPRGLGDSSCWTTKKE